MTNASEIKELYARWQEAHAAMIDSYFSDDDAVFDAANEAEAEAEIAFKNAMVEFTGLAFDDVTRLMVYKRDEFEALVARVA